MTEREEIHMKLEELTGAFGVSGSEKEVAGIIRSHISPKVDGMETDALGNVIALKKGCGENKKRIMVAAHMDEIGFSVVSVNDKGFVRLRAIGGVSVHASFMGHVRFKNGTIGMIGHDGDLSENKNNDIGRLYADTGARSREEALKMVSVGETACYHSCHIEFPNGRVLSKALDDRIGCYVLMESIMRGIRPYHDIYFVFTVQEEVGLRGARVAANRVDPHIGVAVDICGSYDTPGTPEGNVVMGGGASIKINDASVLCDEELVGIMERTAKENDIKHQMEVLPAGGTDAGAINMAHNGVKAAGISIPTRYGHSSGAMVDMGDVECCIRLLCKFLEREL